MAWVVLTARIKLDKIKFTLFCMHRQISSISFYMSAKAIQTPGTRTRGPYDAVPISKTSQAQASHPRIEK